MTKPAVSLTSTSARTFPAEELKRRLRDELQKIAGEASALRPEWEPLLDSKRVVGILLVIEDLFPFKLPPDKVVRKGGYNTVDETLGDMLGRIERIWVERSKPGERK